MTDYAAVEYLNLTLAHALYLDAKIDSSDAFIQDEYSVIIPRNLNAKDWIIKINSVCEQENGIYKNYEETEIKISENDKYPLCDNFDSFEYNLIDGNRVYKPIEVILKRKLCE